MRPPEPGFSSQQAARFRREFRRYRDIFTATNEDVGAALDEHKDHLGGRWSDGEGSKAVINALSSSPKRKLTHRVARRLVVGLFLSKPACGSDKTGIADETREFRFAIERAALAELIGLLCKYGALSFERKPALPVFIPPATIERLASELSAEVARVNGIGQGKKKLMASQLCRYLKQSCPAMSRAWSDAALQTPIIRTAGASTARAIEDLTRSAFEEAYIYPSQGASFGPEFDVLDNKRPTLTESLEIPVRRMMSWKRVIASPEWQKSESSRSKRALGEEGPALPS